MRLDELIKDIKDTSLKHVLVNEFGEGDIYEYLNSGEHKYPCVFLTITGLSDDDYTRNVNITLFYVDRLTSDKKNRTQVQSEATNVLGDIIHEFESTNVNYTLFTEKFSDLCAGAYAEFNVTVEYTAGCEQNFIVRTKKIENNGIYNVDGFDSVDVDVKWEMTLKDGTKLSNSTWTQVPGEYDFSNITDFYQMFYGCSNLTTIPQLNTSSGTNFYQMFYYCSKLTAIPQIDTSNGTDFKYMFYKCSKLTTIPQIDTSNGTNFKYMFNECTNLTTISQIDTSKGTDFGYMFNECSNLTTIPQLDFSNGTNFESMFGDCFKLISIPQLNTSSGTDFRYMFYRCSNLTTISQIDVSSGTNFVYMFGSCSKLTNITFTGSINASIEFTNSKLTYDSVKSILTACSNTTKPTTSKTLKFSRTLTDQNGELAALIATCNSKKWTISGLTLQ